MSSTKKFSHEDLAQYDFEAREAVKRFLRARGRTVWSNEDVYGPDLCMADSGFVSAFVEVEIKNHWGDDAFPYATMHIAGRKLHWITGEDKVVFCILNHDATQMWACANGRMTGARLIQKDTLFTAGEWYIEVPTTFGHFYRLNQQ